MKTVKIKNKGPSMSNRQYHAYGCPTWWARVGSGDNAVFLPIPKVRGDYPLNCNVQVNDDVTEIYIGVGPKGKYGVRETIKC